MGAEDAETRFPPFPPTKTHVVVVTQQSSTQGQLDKNVQTQGKTVEGEGKLREGGERGGERERERANEQQQGCSGESRNSKTKEKGLQEDGINESNERRKRKSRERTVLLTFFCFSVRSFVLWYCIMVRFSDRARFWSVGRWSSPIHRHHRLR